MDIKSLIKGWLFSEDVKKLSEILDRHGQAKEAEQFFIRQGKHSVQYQVNNPQLNRVPYSLRGHGLPLGAKYLGIASLRLERARAHEMRKLLSRVNRRD